MKRVLLPILICICLGVFMVVGCDDGLQQVRSCDCSWDSNDVTFSTISLSVSGCPDLVNSLLDISTPYTTLIDPFILFPDYSSLTWESIGTTCSTSTMRSVVTKITQVNDPRLSTAGFTADESLTNDIDIQKIKGTVKLSISNITNYSTGQVGTVVWSKTYNGSGLFHSLDFSISCSFVQDDQNNVPIYIGEQYVQL